MTEQSDAIKKYCAVLGLELDDYSVQEMSQSFGSQKNILLGFKEFLKYGPAGSVSCVLVVDNLEDLACQFPVIRNVFELISLGVEIHSTSDGRIYSAGRFNTQSVLDLALSLEYRPPPRRPKVAKP